MLFPNLLPSTFQTKTKKVWDLFDFDICSILSDQKVAVFPGRSRRCPDPGSVEALEEPGSWHCFFASINSSGHILASEHEIGCHISCLDRSSRASTEGWGRDRGTVFSLQSTVLVISWLLSTKLSATSPAPTALPEPQRRGEAGIGALFFRFNQQFWSYPGFWARNCLPHLRPRPLFQSLNGGVRPESGHCFFASINSSGHNFASEHEIVCHISGPDRSSRASTEGWGRNRGTVFSLQSTVLVISWLLSTKLSATSPAPTALPEPQRRGEAGIGALFFASINSSGHILASEHEIVCHISGPDRSSRASTEGWGRNRGTVFSLQSTVLVISWLLSTKLSATSPAPTALPEPQRRGEAGIGALFFRFNQQFWSYPGFWARNWLPHLLPHPSVEPLEERSGPEMWQPISCSEPRIWSELLIEAKKQCPDPCLTPPLSLWKSGRGRRCGSQFRAQKQGYDQNCWLKRKNSVTIPASPLRWGSGRAVGTGDVAAVFFLIGCSLLKICF